MPFRHGKNTIFKMGTAGDPTTPVDVTTYLSEVSFPQEVETAETTTFGIGARTYVIGLTNSSASISGMFESSFDQHINEVIGMEEPLTFEYGPEGPGTGRIFYRGTGYITSYEKSGGVGDMVSASLDFQVSGPVTRGTYA
jgi:hypothetical protein